MAEHITEESAFNMAFAYLKRIDKILYFCWFHSRQRNIDGWLQDLRALYRELSVKIKIEEDKDIQDDFKAINKICNDRARFATEKKQVLFRLDQLEVKMRRLLQKRGMLLPSKSDPRFAILER